MIHTRSDGQVLAAQTCDTVSTFFAMACTEFWRDLLHVRAFLSKSKVMIWKARVPKIRSQELPNFACWIRSNRRPWTSFLLFLGNVCKRNLRCARVTTQGALAREHASHVQEVRSLTRRVPLIYVDNAAAPQPEIAAHVCSRALASESWTARA